MKQVNAMLEQEREELLKQITKDLKESLSEKRFLHSVSTMKKAKELANKYNEDEMTAMLTALAHDIAKEMSREDYFEYAKQNNVELDEFDKMQDTMLHGKIGADIVAKRYGFTKKMQDAIYYHTTGRARMTVLDKIIFLADKTENGREGEDIDKLRQVLNKSGLDAAVLWDIENHALRNLIVKRKLIHPNCVYARNDIIAKQY